VTQPPSHPLASFRFHIDLRPRFSDLDGFGHVNNANYFTYFEEGRVAYAYKLGIFLLQKSPISFVIQEASCRFLLPLMHHHRFQVYLRAADWEAKRFSFYYALWLPQEEALAATGHSIAVAYDFKKKQAALIPDEYLQKMKRFERADEK
jgi:acyl-CoA thioester hydrolase